MPLYVSFRMKELVEGEMIGDRAGDCWAIVDVIFGYWVNVQGFDEIRNVDGFLVVVRDEAQEAKPDQYV